MKKGADWLKILQEQIKSIETRYAEIPDLSVEGSAVSSNSSSKILQEGSGCPSESNPKKYCQLM